MAGAKLCSSSSQRQLWSIFTICDHGHKHIDRGELSTLQPANLPAPDWRAEQPNMSTEQPKHRCSSWLITRRLYLCIFFLNHTSVFCITKNKITLTCCIIIIYSTTSFVWLWQSAKRRGRQLTVFSEGSVTLRILMICRDLWLISIRKLMKARIGCTRWFGFLKRWLHPVLICPWCSFNIHSILTNLPSNTGKFCQVLSCRFCPATPVNSLPLQAAIMLLKFLHVSFY